MAKIRHQGLQPARQLALGWQRAHTVVDHLPLTVFRRSALASGLLTVEQILEAESAVRAAHGSIGTWVEVDDGALAAKLVEQGHLNPWQAAMLKSGRVKFSLGPYQVIDAIGQGGMGQVFLAEHKLMGRVVAIKVLPRHRSTPDAVASFAREIRAASAIRPRKPGACLRRRARRQR